MSPRNLYINDFVVDMNLLNNVKEKKEKMLEASLKGEINLIKYANLRKNMDNIKKLAMAFTAIREHNVYAEDEIEIIKNLKNAWKYLSSPNVNPEKIDTQDILKTSTLASTKVRELHPNTFRYEAVQAGTRYYDNTDNIHQLIDNMLYQGKQTDDLLVRGMYYHLEIAHQQPFIDGNKRTGRLISAIQFFKEGFPVPLIPLSDHKKYTNLIDAVSNSVDNFKSSNEIRKNTLMFTNYILKCTDASLDILRDLCAADSHRAKYKS